MKMTDRTTFQTHLVRILLGAAFCLASVPAISDPSEVLVSVGSLQVTASDLNSALASSPFSTQINAMDEDDQAGLRGDILRRLVAARLLSLEARRLGMDKTKAYRQDVENFRLGLLYRYYFDKLRARIVIPKTTLDAMKQQFKNDADGLAAAKAAFISEQYQPLKRATLINLRQRAKISLHDERIKPTIKPETVLMEGKNLRIRYGDIVDAAEHPSLPNPEWVKEQLYKRGELLLVARAADKEGVDVTDKLAQYENERLPAAMLETKTQEWIPGEATLHDWFDKHPEVSLVAERRHVGQLVVNTRNEADQLRARILKGESLFSLAGEHSIDPVSRKQNGDIGWLVAGRGMPELDQALSKLEDNQVSEVIETKLGFHVLTILERQAGRQEPYAAVRDRIRQIVINENMRPYLGELERRYPVSWRVMKPRGEASPAQSVP
jgi:peptidyl-prolyl cis-trans isomerase C